jgi:hypothetical protein
MAIQASFLFLVDSSKHNERHKETAVCFAGENKKKMEYIPWVSEFADSSLHWLFRTHDKINKK